MSRPQGDYDDTTSARRPTQPQNLQLTPEEQAVLKQCQTESFWYRSLPLSVALMTSTTYLIRIGKIGPSAGFFKSFGAGVLGYIAGKASYIGTCKEKILRLENSALADAIRKGQSAATSEILEMSLPMASQNERNQEQSRLDSDSVRKYQELNENARPTLDSNPVGQAPRESAKEPDKGVSYDDLRQKHRMEQHGVGRPPSSPPSAPAAGTPYSPPSSSYSPPSYSPPSPQPSSGKKSGYGDVGFD